METSTKVAVGVGAAVVATIVIVGVLEHKASAAQGCQCPDGTPCPGGDPTQCGQLGNSVGPSSDSGQTYDYNGQVQADVMAKAQALAAVNPCDKANEQVVRDFQGAAGLVTLPGSPSVAPDWNQVTPPGTDGRYASNTRDTLAKVLGVDPSAVPAPCVRGSTVTWWGPPGSDVNP